MGDPWPIRHGSVVDDDMFGPWLRPSGLVPHLEDTSTVQPGIRYSPHRIESTADVRAFTGIPGVEVEDVLIPQEVVGR